MSLKVSILIPTYNQSAYILDAVESAIAQTYFNKEIIIADDNSTDNSEEVLKPYLDDQFPVRYYKSQTRLGRVNNYHKALYEYSTGDLALLLDGDDFLIDNNYISKAVKIFEQNQDIVLVFAKHKTLFEADNTLIEDNVNSHLQSLEDGNYLFINYWKGYSIPHLTSMYNRHYALKINYYSEDIQSTDWESVLRLIQGKKVGFVNQYVAVWRKHETNASRAIDNDTVLQNLRYIENAHRYALERGDFSERKLQKWQEKMLKRYFLRILVQADFYSPTSLSGVWTIMKSYSPALYRKMRFDFKYVVFRILKLYRPLLFFVTKHVLKQESMLKDLELYGKQTSND